MRSYASYLLLAIRQVQRQNSSIHLPLGKLLLVLEYRFYFFFIAADTDGVAHSMPTVSMPDTSFMHGPDQ